MVALFFAKLLQNFCKTPTDFRGGTDLSMANRAYQSDSPAATSTYSISFDL
jgi:hypothetical protein